jgi:hypothetical protein
LTVGQLSRLDVQEANNNATNTTNTNFFMLVVFDGIEQSNFPLLSRVYCG